MISHRHITGSKIIETITGLILFAIALAMRLAPIALRDESGAGYINVAILLFLGCWAIFEGLFK